MKRFILAALMLVISSVVVSAEGTRPKLELFGLSPGSTISTTALSAGTYNCKEVPSQFGNIVPGLHDLVPAAPGQEYCFATNRIQQDSNTMESAQSDVHFSQTLPGGFGHIAVEVDRRSLTIKQITGRVIFDPFGGYKLLVAKFGKADTEHFYETQNGYGATFPALHAEWKFPDGAELTFDTIDGKDANIAATSGEVVRAMEAVKAASLAREKPL